MASTHEVQIKERNSFLQGVGLAFIMSGYMYAWTIGNAVGLSSFIGIGFFFIVGMILIVSMSAKKKIPIFFLSIFSNPAAYLMCAIIILLSVTSTGASPKDIAWAIFGLGLLVCVFFIDVKDGNHFCFGYLWTVTLAAFVYLFGVQDSLQGAIQYGDSSRVNLSEENEAYTLVAYAGGFAIVSALYGFANRIINPIISLPILVLGLLTVIMAGTRSIYLGLFLSIVYVFMKSKLDKKQISNLFFGFFILALAIWGLYFSGLLEERLNEIFGAIDRAARTILGLSTVEIDDAANGRVIQRERSLSLIWQNLSMGAGFKAYWVDFPLLQAFSDLGVFFGFLYMYVVFLAPVIICFSLKKLNPTEGLLCALYVLNMPRLFLHGQPYDWPIFGFAFLPYIITINRRWASMSRSPNKQVPNYD